MRNIVNYKTYYKKGGEIIYNTKENSGRSKNKDFVYDYFDVIDSEYKAYFLGLLITDGCVDDKRVRICLKSEDKYILDIFKRELKVKNLYYDPRKSGTYSLEISSKYMVNSLNKYGIIKNKTYLLKRIPLENIPNKYINHFFRGIFDGDGCISYSEKWKYRLSVTEYNYSLVEQIRDELDKITKRNIHRKIQKANSYFCCWNKKNDIKNILDFLYKDATIYLKRKHDRYISFLEYYNNK